MRHLVTASLVVLALCGLYSISGDAAEQIPGPIGGALRRPDANHAPPVVPAMINFQGRLLDPLNGDPLPDATYSVRFSIHTDVVGGFEQWNETKNVTTVGGVFSTLLGSTTPIPNSAFGGSTPGRWLEVKIGADPPLTPRQQFTSVAYALFAGGANLANNSELIDGFDSSQFLRSDISATQAASLTVAGNFAVNQATTLGNGAGADPVIVNDDLTVNGSTQLGDALDDPTTITGPLDTLSSATIGGNATLAGDLVVEGNNIDNGASAQFRIDPTAATTGTLLLGGSNSQSDDVQIVDGSLCVGNGGCDLTPTDGSLRVEGGATFRTDTLFDADIGVGNDPAFDSTGQVVFSNEASLSWDSTDNDSPSFQFSHAVDTVRICAAASVNDCDSAAPAACFGCIVADGNITANAFDLAERFEAIDANLTAGDLVLFAESGARVRRSDGTPYDARIAGIVSGDPGFTLGWATDGDVPVALQGRVPLNVTLENGPIAPGDYLTSSSTPGHAMKATAPGATIGVALEAFDGAAGDRGQVLTFVARGDAHTASAVQALEVRIAELEGERPDADRAVSADAASGSDAPSWLLAGVAGGLLLVLASIVVAARVFGRSDREAAA